MKITIERADGTKVHIEGDEESVTRIARELSPPPVQPIQIAPRYPNPCPIPDLWRFDRIGVPYQPVITWTSDGAGQHGGAYSTGQPS